MRNFPIDPIIKMSRLFYIMSIDLTLQKWTIFIMGVYGEILCILSDPAELLLLVIYKLLTHIMKVSVWKKCNKKIIATNVKSLWQTFMKWTVICTFTYSIDKFKETSVSEFFFLHYLTFSVPHISFYIESCSANFTIFTTYIVQIMFDSWVTISWMVMLADLFIFLKTYGKCE